MSARPPSPAAPAGPPAEAAGPAGRDRLVTLALAAGLALAVTAAQLPVLGARAVALDDTAFVVQNPLVLHPSAESVRRVFAEVLDPSTVSAYYLPLSMTSLMLDVAAGGSPTRLEPFHVTNLALHVAGTLLLYLLLRRLFGAAVPAALAALLYGVHPLMVEPVASVGERKTVLATALAFASAWAHVRFAREGARRWRWASAGLFALALLAKPSVVALPLVLLVLDAWPLRRLSARAVLEKWPLLLLAAAGSAITVLSVQRTWEFGAPPPLDLPLRALQVVWLLGFYAGRIAWPVDLSTIYAPPAPFTLSNPAVGAGAAAGIALACAAWLARRRAPALLAGGATFVLLLSPTFGVLRFGWVIAYDRYVQLPFLGVSLALAAGLAALWRSPRGSGAAARAALAAGVLALATAESAATRATIDHWRDSLTLWRHAVRVSPGVPDSHNGLGATYSELHRSDAAIAEFQRAIAVAPDYVDAHQNLGRELLRSGRVDAALPHLEFAASHAPGSPGAALELGLGLEAAARYADAEAQFRRALALRPGYAPALSALGVALVVEGRDREGVTLLRDAVARSSGEPGAVAALAAALVHSAGPGAEAVALLHQALERDPRQPEALNELAWLRATAADPAWRDTSEALRLSERALTLATRPDANTLDTRAAALAAAGRFAEAAVVAERAVALAHAEGQDSLESNAAVRLRGYRAGRPFVQPRRPDP